MLERLKDWFGLQLHRLQMTLRMLNAARLLKKKPAQFCSEKLAEYSLGFRDVEKCTFDSCRLESFTKHTGQCKCSKYLYGRRSDEPIV